MRYFGETYDKTDCGGCDVCLAEREAFDATEIAQMVLSAVIRTGERFGRAHVINVLRGSRAKKVMEWRHHELPVYGIARRVRPRRTQGDRGTTGGRGAAAAESRQVRNPSRSTTAGHDFLRRRERDIDTQPNQARMRPNLKQVRNDVNESLRRRRPGPAAGHFGL